MTKQTANPGTRLKKVIVQLLENNVEQLQKDINEMSPKERANFLIELSEFILPKLARTQTELSGDTMQSLRTWAIEPVSPKDEQ